MVYEWLKQKQRPPFVTPGIEANSLLYTYYKQFQLLYIDPTSYLIKYYTPDSRIFEDAFINTINTEPAIN